MRKFTLFFSLFVAVATTAMADFDFRWLASTYYGSDITLPNGASLNDGLTAAKMKEIFVKVENEGDVTMSFTYSTTDAKPCALNVVGVDLVNLNGEIVKSHYENKKAGGDGAAQVYTLSGVKAGYYTLRYFVGYGNNDRLNDTSGAIAVTNAVNYVTPVFSYSGISEYPYELPSADVANIRTLGGAMTIMADVSITNTDNNSIIFASTADYTAASTTEGNILGFGCGGNQMRAFVSVAESAWYSKDAVSAGDKSLAYTITDETKAYYVDNVKQGTDASFSGTFSAHTGTNAKMYIGGVKHSTSTVYAAFNGTINRVNIYESVLTTEQMLSARKAETIIWAKAFAGENPEVDALLAEIDVAEDFAAIATVKLKVNKAVAKTFFDEYAGKVGYPTDAVINTYKDAVEAAGSLAEIETAKNAVYASTDINMPIDGHVYTITSVNRTAQKAYIFYNGTKLLANKSEVNDNTCKFVCRKLVSGKYIFVPVVADRYVVGRNVDNNTGDETGVIATYNEENCSMVVTKITDANVTVDNGTLTDADLFGMFKIEGKDYYWYVNPNNNNNGYATFHRDSKTRLYFNSNGVSNAFIIEEAEYANKPALNAVGESPLLTSELHNTAMATFSAPFATVVPENVTAYYATAGDGFVTLNAIAATEAIPANTGVILVGAESGSITMRPAAGETAATIENNVLANSAGAVKTIPANSYVLSAKDGVAGFYNTDGGDLAMNKAYIAGVAALASVELRFPGTTAVEKVEMRNEKEEIYDLQGRRIDEITEPGIYIVNGVKVLVK